MSKISVVLNFFLLFVIIFILLKLKILGGFGLGKVSLLDFDTYYQTVQDINKGLHPYELPYMQTMGPPSVIIPFMPFYFFPLQIGRAVLIWTSMFAAGFACSQLAKLFTASHHTSMALFLFCLLMTSFPARFTLAMGQPNLIIMAMLTQLLLIKNEKIKAVLLSILLILKTFFMILFLAFIKKFHLIKLTIVTSLIIVLPTFLILKPKFYFDYLTTKLIPITIEISSITNLDYYNQSLRSTLTRFSLGDYYLIVWAVFLCFSIIYLIKTQNFQAGVILSILLSPVVWQHYLAMILPIIVLVWLQLIKEKNIMKFCLFGIGLFCWWIEIPWLQSAPPNMLNKILASHYFWSLLIFLYLVVFNPTSSIKEKRSLTLPQNFSDNLEE